MINPGMGMGLSTAIDLANSVASPSEASLPIQQLAMSILPMSKTYDDEPVADEFGDVRDTLNALYGEPNIKKSFEQAIKTISKLTGTYDVPAIKSLMEVARIS